VFHSRHYLFKWAHNLSSNGNDLQQTGMSDAARPPIMSSLSSSLPSDSASQSSLLSPSTSSAFHPNSSSSTISSERLIHPNTNPKFHTIDHNTTLDGRGGNSAQSACWRDDMMMSVQQQIIQNNTFSHRANIYNFKKANHMWNAS